MLQLLLFSFLEEKIMAGLEKNGRIIIRTAVANNVSSRHNYSGGNLHRDHPRQRADVL